jgi:lysophospholipase L1-like esterase
LSDVFDSVEVQLYRDNVHLSNEGRNLIAQRMASVIIHEMHKQGD